MAYMAGQYTAAIGANALGQIDGGITIEHFVNKQLITGDNQGSTPQDAVYQGHEAFASFTLIEADNAYVRDLFWPYDTTNEGRQGIIGRLDVQNTLFVTITLTAVLNTPTDGTPDIIVLQRAILAEGFPVSILYAPALREIPLRLRLYPDANGDFWTPTYE